jgi:Ca2+/Na+ antiporter
VPLDWWPVSRDCLAYGVTVAILICIIHDERVEWYEALTLVLLYIVYIAVMYWDKSFQRCTRFRTNDDQISSDSRRVTSGKITPLAAIARQISLRVLGANARTNKSRLK